jgi:hypothetical protein
MRKALYLVVAAGAVLTVAGPASADNGAPSIAQVYDAGRCFVAQDRRAAVGLLQSVPFDGQTADLSGLPRSLARCAQGLGTPAALHLRGAIAQALFFRDFGGFGLEPRRSAALVNLDLPVQDSEEGSRRSELYRWSDCVVRNDAPNVERLMESRVGSAAEASAIAALRNYMAACVPGGGQLTTQPSELRSVVAQSAYHSMYRYWTRDLQPVRDQ